MCSYGQSAQHTFATVQRNYSKTKPVDAKSLRGCGAVLQKTLNLPTVKICRARLFYVSEQSEYDGSLTPRFDPIPLP